MKKFWTLTLILLAGFTIQSTFAQGIGVGVKGGVNFANVDIQDVNTNSYTGYHVGPYLILAFSEKFAIQPELLFEAKGAEFEGGNFEDQKSKFNYFSIPVLLRWKPVSVLSLHAGPQFGFLTGAEAGDEDISDQIKNSDFGLAMGATVHLPLGLNAGGRYVLGFTNVSDLADDTEIKNRVFQIFVGWTIFGAK